MPLYILLPINFIQIAIWISNPSIFYLNGWSYILLFLCFNKHLISILIILRSFRFSVFPSSEFLGLPSNILEQIEIIIFLYKAIHFYLNLVSCHLYYFLPNERATITIKHFIHAYMQKCLINSQRVVYRNLEAALSYLFYNFLTLI